MKNSANLRFGKADHFLVSVVVGLSFFMMVIEESSLYTILPKYLDNKKSNLITNWSWPMAANRTLSDGKNKSPQYVLISIIFLVKNLAMIVFNPVTGFISDKTNNYFILMLSHVLGIAVLVIYAFNKSVSMFIIGRVVDAVVTCIIFVAVYFIISKLFKKTTTRGRYYGYVNTVFAVGHSIGPVYGAVVDNRWGKEAVFIILMPFWLTCAIITYVLYRRVEISDKENNRSLVMSSVESTQVVRVSDNLISKKQSIAGVGGSGLTKEIEVRSKEPNILSKGKAKCFFLLEVLSDRLVMACMLQIFVVNLSMFSLPATLPSWMGFELHSTEVHQGMVWSFGFIGYVFGVVSVSLMDSYHPSLRHFIPICAQTVMGILLITLPFSLDWRLLFLPIIGMYVSVGIVEQVILPLTTYLADRRHHSNYGTMAALTSQSLNISSVFSTLCSGYLAENIGFRWLVISLGVINLLFSPISLLHRKINPV